MRHAEDDILVIDDDDGVRAFVVDSLESLGYSVRAASNGPAELALINCKIPHLPLVDFAMAGMTGIDVINVVQQLNRHCPQYWLPVMLKRIR
jgi:CheY-like chemotaxis protein